MTRELEKQILVAGVGNAWLRDDGFGGEVAKRLRGARAAVRRQRDGLRHGRPRPRLRGHARLRRAGAGRRQPPGRRAGHAVRDRARRGRRRGRDRGRRDDRPARRWTRRRCCASSSAVGGWPGKVVVIACEPAEVEEVGLGLSRAGRGAVDRAVDARARDDRELRPSAPQLEPCTSSRSPARSSTPSAPRGGRRVTAVHLRVGHLRQVVPDSLAFYFEHRRARHRVRGRAAGAGGRAGAPALRGCAHEWELDVPAFRCPGCGAGAT